MPLERGLEQRGIVGRRLVLADGQVETKYTLPFVDASGHVPFVVLDLLGRRPCILRAPIHSEVRQLRTPASIGSLQAIESIPVEDFASLIHFDPWWAFRGVSGVPRSWIEAIIASNIARPFREGDETYKVHDLRFADGMGRLEALVAKDPYFRQKEFHPGEIDLLRLRPKPEGRQRSAETPTAKAL